MTELISISILLGLAVIVIRMYLSSQSDQIIAQAKLQDNEAKKQAYEKQAADLTKEIENAKIKYDNARRALDNKPGSGGESV